MQRNQHRSNDRHNSGYQDRSPFHGSQYTGGRRGGGSTSMEDYERDEQHDPRSVSRQFADDDYSYYGPNDNVSAGRRTFRGEHDDRPVIGDRHGYDDDDRFGRSGHERQRFDHDHDDGRWGRDHAQYGGSYETYDDQRRMTPRDGGSRYASSRGYRDQGYSQRAGQGYGGYRSSRMIGEPRYGSAYDPHPSDFNVSHDYGYGRNRSYGEENIRGMQGRDDWRGGSRYDDDYDRHDRRPRMEQPDRRWFGNGYESDRRNRR